MREVKEGKKFLQTPLPQGSHPHFCANSNGREGQFENGAEAEFPRQKAVSDDYRSGPLTTCGKAEGWMAKISRNFKATSPLEAEKTVNSSSWGKTKRNA